MLDGAARIGAMVQEAAAQGSPAIAVTDHGNTFAAFEFYKAAKDAGIKPIIGCEVYVAIGSRHDRTADRGLQHASNHLILLAKNDVGWRNLTRQDQLKSCIKRICSFCFPTKCRIFKDQHPSLGFFGTDDLSGFEEKGADVLITPEMRDCSGDR